MQRSILGQLGVKRRAEYVTLTQQHGLTPVASDHVYRRIDMRDAWSANEHEWHSSFVVFSTKAVELSAVSITAYIDIEPRKRRLSGGHVAGDEDQSRTCGEHGDSSGEQYVERRTKSEPLDEIELRRALSTRKDQAFEGGELVRITYGAPVDPDVFEGA